MVPLFGDHALQGIVKLAYDQEIIRGHLLRSLLIGTGLEGYEVWFDSPYIGAGTFHVEITAPEDVEMYEAGVIPVASAGEKPKEPYELQRRSGRASKVHLYVDDARNQHGALTWIRLRARRRGFVGVAATVAVMIATLLWLAYLLADQVKSSPAGAPELLLLFPAVIAAYAGRAGRHPFTTRFLFVARMALLSVSATPFIAAAAVALVPRSNGKLVDERFHGWWLGSAIFATACAFVLILACVMPLPLRTRQKIWFRLAAALRGARELLGVVIH
jgi:hypothetical protein